MGSAGCRERKGCQEQLDRQYSKEIVAPKVGGGSRGAQLGKKKLVAEKQTGKGDGRLSEKVIFNELSRLYTGKPINH